MLNILKTLNSSREILGLNRRNAAYVRPYNSSRAKRIADDKLLCKKILSRSGIPTAEIYKVIRTPKQLETIRWEDFPKSFALKPNIGTGGSGIMIFYGKKKNALEWIRPDGTSMNVSQIKDHILRILEGQYSMGNRKDIAIVEERIVNNPLLKQFSYKGIPDIRVIVFNKVPIMAELRLPTYESAGKANLHAGGIGVGIDIATGITTTSIHRKHSPSSALPGMSDLYDIVDTTLDEKRLLLRGVTIPEWKKILEIAILCQQVSGLGYTGVDIALDRDKGPVVFELNARPGLSVQIANLAGIRERVERVRGLKIKDATHGIRVAQNLFGGEVEDEVKELTGRQIIGLVEKATLFAYQPETELITSTQHKKKMKSTAADIKNKISIDTGIRVTRISERIASRLGYNKAIEYFNSLKLPEKFENFEEAIKFQRENEKLLKGNDQILETIAISENNKIQIRPIIRISFELINQKMESLAIVSSRTDMPYPVIIGRRDLQNFLIDTSKTFVLH